MIKRIATLMLLGTSFAPQALTIDSMLLVADEGGNGAFSLTNDLQQTSFIKGTISQINVLDGEIEEVKYTEDNFSDWEVTLTHPKLILEAGRTKQVGVRSLCGQKCSFGTDHVYKVAFEPSAYDPEGLNASKVAINFGYAPLFIIPAKESNVEYEIENKGDSVYVNNTGNTYIRVVINECTKEVIDNCKANYTVLAGRKRSFDLPVGLQGDQVETIIVNHDETYRERKVISKK